MYNSKRKHVKSFNKKEFLNYLIVSIISLLIDVLSLSILYAIGSYYLIASLFGFIFGLITNYYLANKYVFHEKKIHNNSVNFSIYSAIGLGGLALNELILWLLHSNLKIQLFIAKFTSVFIVFIWNYSARKLILYPEKKETVILNENQ